ncbi:hypothetical protein DICVIV_01194 [Dictyocaulus viviparus]|uniref:Uncharacterized protein n=1 Tax=Dictyocaulus viviparus TaxID=29172 RepID=A0A0D8Y9D2_DICVI|nr:hypothetical protein DICVIV_01194 [Dictyocaulus viviparus]
MICTIQSIRCISTIKQDLVQQAFIKKIREYGQKSGDLFSQDANVKKAFHDELNRLAAKFHLANADVVNTLPVDFEIPKIDSSVQQILEGVSLQTLVEDVQKQKADYIASKEAKKAAEEARLTALKH